jgi:hypothetical protein
VPGAAVHCGVPHGAERGRAGAIHFPQSSPFRRDPAHGAPDAVQEGGTSLGCRRHCARRGITNDRLRDAEC